MITNSTTRQHGDTKMKSSSYFNVDGFHIGYFVEDGNIFMNAHDVCRYFGYRADNYGRVSAVLNPSGVGLIKKHLKYSDVDMKQDYYYDKFALNEFRWKSKKSPMIIAKKTHNLKNAISELENSFSQPKKESKTIIENVERINAKSVSVEGDKVKLTFESGRATFKDIDDVEIFNKRAANQKDVCEISGQYLKKGDRVYKFNRQVKGYGVYRVLENAVEKPCRKKEDPVPFIQKVSGWFKGIFKGE